MLAAAPLDDDTEAEPVGLVEGHERVAHPAQMGGPSIGQRQDDAEDQGAHAQLTRSDPDGQ